MAEKTNSTPKELSHEGRYDPVQKAEEVAKVVCKDEMRKYHRFRPARFYGGIATADCVGCCLRCLFCWSWPKVIQPEQYGRFYSPDEVARTLTGIARKKGFRQMRISGNEPTIGRNHLIKVLEFVPKDILFILETNGILIGQDETYADDLARHENLYVRVSLKGCNEEEFSKLTGAQPRGFALQLKALENLSRAGVDVHPAVMVSFSRAVAVEALRARLGKIDRAFQDIEVEELAFWGDVEQRLIKAKIECGKAYHVDGIPPEQV